MDANKLLSSGATTSDHKDPTRAGVGTTAFGAAVHRAMETSHWARKPLIRDHITCAMFGLTSHPKEVPFVFCILYALWRWMPLTWLFFQLIKLVNRDLFKITDMIAMRSKFIDDNVSSAVENKGVSQVVILGAGLDARAARLPALASSESKATVYEIDFKGMLDAKKRMFDHVGFGKCYDNDDTTVNNAVHVPTDLSKPPEQWQRDLLNAGFNKKKPSIWVMEGVTGYLSQDELSLCLQTISGLACKGSLFCATWNGTNSRKSPAPWTQNIHIGLYDNPDEVLAPLKWKRDKFYSVGDATEVYDVTQNIDRNDNSYWLSLHVKS